MIAMLIPAGSPGAALLVRRADGAFSLQRIDARVARAARLAARLRDAQEEDAPSAAEARVGLETI